MEALNRKEAKSYSHSRTAVPPPASQAPQSSIWGEIPLLDDAGARPCAGVVSIDDVTGTKVDVTWQRLNATSNICHLLRTLFNFYSNAATDNVTDNVTQQQNDYEAIKNHLYDHENQIIRLLDNYVELLSNKRGSTL